MVGAAKERYACFHGHWCYGFVCWVSESLGLVVYTPNKFPFKPYLILVLGMSGKPGAWAFVWCAFWLNGLCSIAREMF